MTSAYRNIGTETANHFVAMFDSIVKEYTAEERLAFFTILEGAIHRRAVETTAQIIKKPHQQGSADGAEAKEIAIPRLSIPQENTKYHCMVTLDVEKLKEIMINQNMVAPELSEKSGVQLGNLRNYLKLSQQRVRYSTVANLDGVLNCNISSIIKKEWK